MNWEALAAIAETVGAAGVIITLIYLAIQIRQNTRAQRGIVVDSLTSSIIQINAPATQDASLGLAYTEAMQDWEHASRESRAQAHFFLFSFYKIIENAYFQHRQGVLSQDEWDGWDRMTRANFHASGVRDHWWPLRRMAYSEAFREYLESSVSPEGIVPLNAVLED